VDEFQDTNLIQYQLIQQIVKKYRNICVVGDDDQSIYRWRGAEVGNILNFENDFPETKVITLEQNYRSTQSILQAANHVVLQNRLRKPKALWTENPEGELLTLYVAEDERDEARFVVQEIQKQCGLAPPPNGPRIGSNRTCHDIAVFYRINAQSRAIEDELVRHRIPYTVVGGMKFYERKEIKDVLAYLKLLINPSDGLSLKRIINTPPRGIGEKTIEKMEAFSRERKLSLFEGLKQALKEGQLPSGVKEKIETFIALIEEFQREPGSFSPSQLTLALLARTGYLDRLKGEGTDEALSRVENVEELINVMMESEQGGEEVSVGTFLDKVALVSDIDLYENKGNRVSLMTLHCAKGLEFPVVFILGMEEGLLPHYRRGEEIEDLEEERRLCYVGITRAKEKLFLSRAERRTTFGIGRSNLPSRFLDELPIALIQMEDRRREEEGSPSADQEWGGFFQSPPEVTYPRDSANPFPAFGERTLIPEGFLPLRIGMRVRHPKFGVGRVRSVEGMDENQKATILFQTVGSKRLKVCYAHLEILE
jgi:DNA helicase-2/ATP-dependent DNA helicase PcrA